MGQDFVEFPAVVVPHFCPTTHSVSKELLLTDRFFCGDITSNSFNALDNSTTFVGLVWGISALDAIRDDFASTFGVDDSTTRVGFNGFLGWRALIRACADDWKAMFFGDIYCDRWEEPTASRRKGR